jgi:hypothetical protein
MFAGVAPAEKSFAKAAVDLVALAPDVILASGGTAAGPVLEVTRTVPTVFTLVTDPVGGGLVESLSRPGGNAQGDRAARQASGGSPRCQQFPRDRPIWPSFSRARRRHSA